MIIFTENSFISWTVSQLISTFKKLGIKLDDSVVVHSSYKSIGDVTGGPRAVIHALSEIILPDGALLFPNLNILITG